MSAKAIFEADGKAIVSYFLTRSFVHGQGSPLPTPKHNAPPKLAALHFAADADVNGVLDQAEMQYPWLMSPGASFVAKPDQLIKRRGKLGLLCLNKSWAECREWIEARAGKPQKVEQVEGVLRQFLVEPFVKHEMNTEYYISIMSEREVCGPISFTSCGLVKRFRPDSARVRWERKEQRSEIWSCSGHVQRNPQVLFSGRPDEGSACPDPLLLSTHPLAFTGRFISHMQFLLLVPALSGNYPVVV